MAHLSNDHKDHRNQHENSHKLCDETGHPVFSLKESQQKLRQQTTGPEFCNEGKAIGEKILALKKEIKSKG